MIYYSKDIPLQWNNFRIIYGEHKLFIRFNVTIETERLSVFNLSSKRSDRLELIKSLSDNGMSNVEISDYLNCKGKLSVRCRSYTPKLIRGLLKKYQNRLDRFKSDRIVHQTENLCVIPTNRNLTKPK